jgi:hypothetical protein
MHAQEVTATHSNTSNVRKLTAEAALRCVFWMQEVVGSPAYPALHAQLNVLLASAEHTASAAQLCKLELQTPVKRLGKGYGLLNTVVPLLDSMVILVPSGDHAIDRTPPYPIENANSSILLLLVLHTRACPEIDTAAILVPSGDHAIALMLSIFLPEFNNESVNSVLPPLLMFGTLHTRVSPEADIVAILVLSGDHAIDSKH